MYLIKTMLPNKVIKCLTARLRNLATRNTLELGVFTLVVQENTRGFRELLSVRKNAGASLQNFLDLLFFFFFRRRMVIERIKVVKIVAMCSDINNHSGILDTKHKHTVIRNQLRSIGSKTPKLGIQNRKTCHFRLSFDSLTNLEANCTFLGVVEFVIRIR